MDHAALCQPPTGPEPPSHPQPSRGPPHVGPPDAPPLSRRPAHPLRGRPPASGRAPPPGARDGECPEADARARRHRCQGPRWAAATAPPGGTPPLLGHPSPSQRDLSGAGPQRPRHVHGCRTPAQPPCAGRRAGGPQSAGSPEARLRPHTAPPLCPPSARVRRASMPHARLCRARLPDHDGPLHAPDSPCRRQGTRGPGRPEGRPLRVSGGRPGSRWPPSSGVMAPPTGPSAQTAGSPVLWRPGPPGHPAGPQLLAGISRSAPRAEHGRTARIRGRTGMAPRVSMPRPHAGGNRRGRSACLSRMVSAP
jgi:hypothetical protein